MKGLETAFTILLNPKKKTNMSENSDKLYWVYDKKTGKIKGFDKLKDAVKYDKLYWVYDKKTGKIKGFDKWKDAVKYDKLLKQNKDEDNNIK